MITLEIYRFEEHLRIFLKEDNSTATQYHTIDDLNMKGIEKQCGEVIEILNKSSRKKNEEQSALTCLKNAGMSLCDKLFTQEICERLAAAPPGEHLIIKLDDHLVHIPFELVCVGGEFLCRKFNIGRNVITRQRVSNGNSRPISDTIRMWVIANPRGDLRSAAVEGVDICDQMDFRGDIVNAELDSEITSEKIKSAIRNYDFVHFSGHAEYNHENPEQSGWSLNDGYFSAGDVVEMKSGSMPVLVFSNACRSAYTGEWDYSPELPDKSFGLANAFILAGVRHYIGTAWNVRDEAGNQFALKFYHHLLSGKTIGESVKLARLDMSRDGGDICWASYILYGDPTVQYFKQTENSEISLNADALANYAPPVQNPYDIPLKGGTAVRSPARPAAKKWLAASIIGFVFLVASVITAAVLISPTEPDLWTSRPLQISVIYHQDEKYDELEDVIAAAVEKEIMMSTRLGMVDRTHLAQTKDEIELSRSDWMNPVRKLNAGQGLPANFRLNLRVSNIASGSRVQMRLIDNETGAYLDVFSKEFDSEISIMDQKNQLAGELLEKLKTLYPLRGIASWKDGQILLNIGSDAGVQPGQNFKSSDTGLVLRIDSVKKDTSTATVENGKDPVKNEIRVEAI